MFERVPSHDSQLVFNSVAEITDVAVLHSNAYPHVTNRVQDGLNVMLLKVLKRPACGPQLWPCDYHILGPSHKILKFTSDDDIPAAVAQQFAQFPKVFFFFLQRRHVRSSINASINCNYRTV